VRRKLLSRLLFVSIFVILLGFLIAKPVFHYLSTYLSKSEHVIGNILIVEGWLPDSALEMASKEFRKNGYEYLVTTGLKASIDYYGLFEDGFLIFYPKNNFARKNEYGEHTIEVDAYSELGGENKAHFNLYINDSIAANFYAEKEKKKYVFSWKGNLTRIDSIMVEFNNDDWGDFGDRNLYVKEITIDNKITIPYLDNSIYVVQYQNRTERFFNNYNSNAEFARKRMMSMGIDSSKIIATAGERVIINRTLTSALAFRNWLKTTNINVKGINIISLGTHTRRTWMIYNKILHRKYKIGIISLPDYNFNHSRVYKLIKTIREILGIIYYWFILIPY
jgi:hypothetical protein